MAYRCVQLSFESETASINTLVAMAQSMTSLGLVVKEGPEGRQSVAFDSDVLQWVDLKPNGDRRVFASSPSAPALYQLIWMAAERLGAEPRCQLAPLPVPVTDACVRRVARRDAQAAAFVLGAIVVAVSTGGALIVWFFRWLFL